MSEHDAKVLVLADTAADYRAALERIPAAYFTVAQETADDPADRVCVLWRLVELYEAAVRQQKRRADAAEAQLAAARRSHLALVPDLNKGA
jgi:hypothetical protein